MIRESDIVTSVTFPAMAAPWRQDQHNMVRLWSAVTSGDLLDTSGKFNGYCFFRFTLRGLSRSPKKRRLLTGSAVENSNNEAEPRPVKPKSYRRKAAPHCGIRRPLNTPTVDYDQEDAPKLCSRPAVRTAPNAI